MRGVCVGNESDFSEQSGVIQGGAALCSSGTLPGMAMSSSSTEARSQVDSRGGMRKHRMQPEV